MAAISRRQVLQATLAGSLWSWGPADVSAAASRTTDREKLPVAGVVTVYQKSSHADVILGKIMEGYQQDGGLGPDLKLVSLYVDQFPENDLSRDLAARFGVRLCSTIDEAVTLGTDQVQVRGVLSIGEHGQYPETPDTRQYMYPRRRFFDEIVAAFRRCGQTAPVFNDKHLAWKYEDALHMVTTARDLNFPLIAGSSVPVAWRYPLIDLPMESDVESALSIGYGGLEAYGFHALEAHQCMLERRRGGETGIESVRAVRGLAIRQAEADGEWSSSLLQAALQTLPGPPRNAAAWQPDESSAVFLLKHRDGLRSAVLMANGLCDQFATAVRIKDAAKPLATWFKLQELAPHAHFAYLLRAVEETFHAGRTVYPVERTLLTTGILDRVMQSLAGGGAEIDTDELAVAWQAADWPFANRADSFRQLPND